MSVKQEPPGCLCEGLGRGMAGGEGQVDHVALGSFDGMRWAQRVAGRGQCVAVPEAQPAHGQERLYTRRLRATYWEVGASGQRRRSQACDERRIVGEYNAED